MNRDGTCCKDTWKLQLKLPCSRLQQDGRRPLSFVPGSAACRPADAALVGLTLQGAAECTLVNLQEW